LILQASSKSWWNSKAIWNSILETRGVRNGDIIYLVKESALLSMTLQVIMINICEKKELKKIKWLEL
jgi:hypothetical protein